ncbi:MAG TPA: hypothetical protein VNP92_01735 [Actinophytocola sp.]|nr:hypothetical protein [Actinophytocola sp.]
MTIEGMANSDMLADAWTPISYCSESRSLRSPCRAQTSRWYWYRGNSSVSQRTGIPQYISRTPTRVNMLATITVSGVAASARKNPWTPSANTPADHGKST